MSAAPWTLSSAPIVVAPMAGGPSTPGFVVAAARAGGLGLLAAGYKAPAEVEAEISAVRADTDGAWGINLFVPGRPTRDAEALDRYTTELAGEAEALGVGLGAASWDDDRWTAKVDIVLDAAPPVVSFAFGAPGADLVSELRQRGSLVVATVTSVDEARLAHSRGVDALCVQGAEAGAHRGSFDDSRGTADALSTLALLADVRSVIDLPVLAAGGVALPDDVRSALQAGAVAVQVGTAFLRCDESGAHPLHKDALVDPRYTTTTTTRAFSGRTARGLRNRFMDEHPTAPSAYPEINNATRPLRAAFAAAGDPSGMSLWAGTGHRHARAEALATVMDWLASDLD